MNDLNSDKIDRLEELLIAVGLNVNDLSSAFSKYLLILIKKGVLKADKKYVGQVLTSLSFSANFGDAQVCDEEKRALRRQMAEIEINLRQTDPTTSNLAKCAGDCLYDESDWQLNNDGNETPLFYYLHHLEQLKPDAADDFFDFFCNHFGITDIKW